MRETTAYHSFIGKERIQQVYRDYGLTPADDVIANMILWKVVRHKGKMSSALLGIRGMLKGNPRYRFILRAVFVIYRDNEVMRLRMPKERVLTNKGR